MLRTSRTRLALSLAIASGFFSLAGWGILTARAQCCGQSAAPTSYLPQVTSSMSYSAGYASDCCQAAPTCGPSYKLESRTVVTKIPVQITRMVDEEVVQKVPYQVTKMVQEEQVRQIPVQTTRMEQQVMTRKVPVTTYKTVTERVEKQVPIQVCKYVAEEQVKQIPVQMTKYVDEVKTEPFSVQVCKMVAEQQTVRKPKTVEKRTPIVRTYLIPRTETYKIPLDAYGNPLEVRDTTPTSRVVEERPRTTTSGKPTLAEDVEKNSNSVMKNGEKTEAQKPEVKKPMTAEDKAPGPEAF